MRASTIRSSLESKLRSLETDLSEWQTVVGDPGVASSDFLVFAKHQSQIARLYDLFSGIVRKLKSELDDHIRLIGPDSFDSPKELSLKILQGHALWAYFRNKFLLRRSPNLRKYLSAADEFAWACFKPLSVASQQVTGDAGASKVPPLIYLGQDLSPFVYPRDWSLSSEIKNVNDQVFRSVIEKAPVSLVSLPYYQTAHLPETMVLAHEMGHVVEMDLGLSTTLDESLEAIPDATIPQQRKEVWKRCRIEAFADVFGATAGGVAFCHALANFLAKSRDKIVNEDFGKKSKYEYPTCFLRVLLALEVLRGKDGKLPPAAAIIHADWIEDYGSHHLHTEYENDLGSIVKCFVDTPFQAFGGKRSIRDIVGLTREDEEQAATDAREMAESSTIPEANDARVLFAAATLAYYESPEKYVARGVENLVLDRIEAIADKVPRAAKNVTASVHESDHARGVGLADLLGSSAEPNAD